jgi:hypothetical protein
MPITNTWTDESKTVLVNDFPETWTWDEFVAACFRGYELIGAVNHTVYIIAKNFVNTPKGNAMLAFKRVEEFPPNLALLIIQSPRTNSIGMTLINVFLKVYGKQAGRVVYVRSMEDAYRLIEKHSQQAQVRAQAL